MWRALLVGNRRVSRLFLKKGQKKVSRPEESFYAGECALTSRFPGGGADKNMVLTRSYTQETHSREFHELRKYICSSLDGDHTVAGSEVANRIYAFCTAERALLFSSLLRWVKPEMLRASQLVRSIHCFMLKTDCITAAGNGTHQLINQYSRVGDYEYAIKVYHRFAGSMDPSAKRAYLDMCSVHLFPAEAEKTFYELVAMDQDGEWDYVTLAMTFARVGLVDETASVFIKYAEITKTFLPPLVNCVVYAFARRGLIEEAYQVATVAMPDVVIVEVCLTLLSCCFIWRQREIAEVVFKYASSKHTDAESRGKLEVLMRNIRMAAKDFIAAEPLKGTRGKFRASSSYADVRFTP